MGRLVLTVRPGEVVDITPADAAEAVTIGNAGTTKIKLWFDAPARTDINLRPKDGSDR